MVYFRKLDAKDWLDFKEIIREAFFREINKEELETHLNNIQNPGLT
ncbi:MAG: hypothetical protein GPJ51_01175 [Candidatus Heimdallarchaeota archaeon]|nr:hypothetical protein [Candidatus Heimdallarchaeota archaeon]